MKINWKPIISDLIKIGIAIAAAFGLVSCVR